MYYAQIKHLDNKIVTGVSELYGYVNQALLVEIPSYRHELIGFYYTDQDFRRYDITMTSPKNNVQPDESVNVTFSMTLKKYDKKLNFTSDVVKSSKILLQITYNNTKENIILDIINGQCTYTFKKTNNGTYILSTINQGCQNASLQITVSTTPPTP